MELPQPLQSAILLRRYKRFLADVQLSNGEQLTIHCPNTGSMKNCQEPGSRVWFSLSNNPKRKYPGTWQVVEVDQRYKVGINTGLANKLVKEALELDLIDELAGSKTIKPEVAYGDQRSRIDLLLEFAQDQLCYVEIKNVSLGMGNGLGLFPDAVTQRGHKHLQELIAMVQQGHRAVLFFCVQHSGIERVSPADEIDPRYGELLREAAEAGVELLAYGAKFDLDNAEITLRRSLPVVLE